MKLLLLICDAQDFELDGFDELQLFLLCGWNSHYSPGLRVCAGRNGGEEVGCKMSSATQNMTNKRRAAGENEVSDSFTIQATPDDERR